VAQALRNKGWKFYQFIGSGGCRLMCAWDTLPETVEQFTAEIRALSAARLIPIDLLDPLTPDHDRIPFLSTRCE
jgi:hypothetical protein